MTLNKVRCLYVDDDAEHLRDFKVEIENQWSMLSNSVPIDVDTARDVADARDKLRIGSYHVFIADILFGRRLTQEPHGLRLMAEARRGSRALAILALSIGDPEFEREARSAGADDYVPKKYVWKRPSEPVLARAILSALRLHEYEPCICGPDVLKLDRETPALKAAVETVGADNIVALAVNAVSAKCESVVVSCVKAGLSGASVLRALCDLTVERSRPPDPRSLLMKISRDSVSLLNELSKDLSPFPDRLFVSWVKKEPVQSGRWFALSSTFEEGALTFSDWLSESATTSAQVARALEDLFNSNRLSGVYERVGRREERPTEVLRDVLNASRTARVFLALHEIGSLACKHDPNGLFDRELIESFLGDDHKFCGVPFGHVPLGCSFCWSHGDLHCRNVLVLGGERVMLIDPASVDLMHWACDVARLSADLIVSPGGAEDGAYEWERIGDWQKVGAAFVKGEEMPSIPPSSSEEMARSALGWIRDQLPRIHRSTQAHPKRKWEFQLALAIEFLRASYRMQELPPPKRVVGLQLACEALRAAKASYESHLK